MRTSGLASSHPRRSPTTHLSLPPPSPPATTTEQQVCISPTVPLLASCAFEPEPHSTFHDRTIMNLGDSNLRTVNVSTPQLVHVNSKQSITASDDYYSLSEGSSNEDRSTIRQYETPPMQSRSADVSRDALHSEAKQSEATIPALSPIKHRHPPDHGAVIPPVIGNPNIKRKPVSSSTFSLSSDGTVVRRPMDQISPPTPGVDDTPYIHFAIEQLTRDEEVTYEDGGSEASYPVERDATLGYHPARIPKPQKKRPDPNWRQQNEITAPDNESILLPAEPTTDDFRHPRLKFKPQSLRLLSLGSLFLCCLLMIIGLLFCAIWPSSHNGLWEYDSVGSGRYFVFQYLPTLLASVIIIWLLIVQNAVHRTQPFIALSSGRGTPNSGVLHGLTIFPTKFIIPDLAFFKHHEPLLGLCSVIFWLALWTVPLQSCLFQTRYYTPDNIWRWTTVLGIAYTLFVLYLLLAFALLLLIFRITFRHTGLKWDPVSLADLLTIFHSSNFLSDFERSEVVGRYSTYFSAKYLRLGYWQTTRQHEAFYGIGEENVLTKRYSLDRGKMTPVTKLSDVDLEAQRPEKQSTFNTLQQDIHTPDVRYRWLPWFLRDGPALAWILIAIALMLAFVIVSFVNSAVQQGFLPQLPAPTSPQGLSPADFLYSFVPSFLGMILFLVWQPIDMYFRALQPFANLANKGGCSAEESLLMDYPSRLPVDITVEATLSGHYRVAWISFMGLLSISLPILAGGVFTAQYVGSNQSVRMIAHLSAYYILVVIVIIYALSFLTTWPTRKRQLPHDISTVGDLVSFFYKSPLLADAVFEEPRSKTDLVTRLMGRLTGEKGFSKYAFGTFTGVGGSEHLGIHRLEDCRSLRRVRTTEGANTSNTKK